MKKKYELVTNDFIILVSIGEKLTRIRALEEIDGDYGRINVGDYGGYIGSERNLTQTGNSWVDHDAWVYGDSLVSGDARVHGDARVFDNAQIGGNTQVYSSSNVRGSAEVLETSHVITIGPIIEDYDYFLTFFRTKTNNIGVSHLDQFWETILKFEADIRTSPEYAKHEKFYALAVEIAKLQIKL